MKFTRYSDYTVLISPIYLSQKHQQIAKKHKQETETRNTGSVNQHNTIGISGVLRHTQFSRNYSPLLRNLY